MLPPDPLEVVHLEEEESGAKVTYQIVGDDEADLKQGLISISSPIVRALIGKEFDQIRRDRRLVAADLHADLFQQPVGVRFDREQAAQRTKATFERRVREAPGAHRQRGRGDHERVPEHGAQARRRQQRAAPRPPS